MILGSPEWVWIGGGLGACLISIPFFYFVVEPNLYRYFGIGEPPKRRKVDVK
jgi:hypothetical protein